MARKSWVAVLTAVLVLSLAAVGSAQIDVKTQLGYGGTSYGKILDAKNAKTTEWSAVALGTYAHDDLLFSASFTSSNSLNVSVTADGEEEPQENSQKGIHRRSNLQFGANYLFLKDTGLKLYGGLGYSMTWVTLKDQDLRDNTQLSLGGKGFAGQAIAQFTLGDKFTADAYLSAAPWYSWEYTEKDDSRKNIGGSHYHYQLGFEYLFAEDYSIRLGMQGGAYSLDKFRFSSSEPEETIELPETSSSYSGVIVGVTWHF